MAALEGPRLRHGDREDDLTPPAATAPLLEATSPLRQRRVDLACSSSDGGHASSKDSAEHPPYIHNGRYATGDPAADEYLRLCQHLGCRHLVRWWHSHCPLHRPKETDQ